MALFHSFLWLSSIPLYTCTTSSLSIPLLRASIILISIYWALTICQAPCSPLCSRMNQTVPARDEVTSYSRPYRSWIPMILSNIVPFFSCFQLFLISFSYFYPCSYVLEILTDATSFSTCLSICFLYSCNNTPLTEPLGGNTMTMSTVFHTQLQQAVFRHADLFGAGTWFCVIRWVHVNLKYLTGVLLCGSFSATSACPSLLLHFIVWTRGFWRPWCVHTYAHSYTLSWRLS